MSIRVLELAEKLKVDTADLIAVCVLLKIPATSRISCLTNDHIEKLTEYYAKRNL
tara:strand:- start:2328 stop:2492 length:165 start_codon:yes stop_codon:yes gene_type:complete